MAKKITIKNSNKGEINLSKKRIIVFSCTVLALVCIFSLSTWRKEAKPDVSEFEKYSYLLVLSRDNKPIGNATGFFVEKCGELYLVSNFHVLTNRKFENLERIPGLWDKISVRYWKEGNWKYFEFDLKRVWATTDQIKDRMPFDCWAVKIPELISEGINKVDILDDALTNLKISKNSNAFVFGFPAKDYVATQNYSQRKAQLIETEIIRYDNGAINAKNMAFTLNLPIFQGMSGSPAFAYGDDGKIKFLGIMFAAAGDDANSLHGLGFRSDVVTTLFRSACN